MNAANSLPRALKSAEQREPFIVRATRMRIISRSVFLRTIGICQTLALLGACCQAVTCAAATPPQAPTAAEVAAGEQGAATPTPVEALAALAAQFDKTP